MNIFENNDTLLILIAIWIVMWVGGIWLNHKFNDVEKRLINIENALILQKIMPQETKS